MSTVVKIGQATLSEISIPVAATMDLGATEELFVLFTAGAASCNNFGTGANKARFCRASTSFSIVPSAGVVTPKGETVLVLPGDSWWVRSNASGVWTVTDFVHGAYGTTTIEVLTGHRTYYVSNSGSASNDGLTPGTAFSHPDQAAAAIQKLHLNGFQAIIQLVLDAPSTPTTFTWTWRITAGPVGPGSIMLQGDIANQDLYFIDTDPGLFSCLGIAIAGRAVIVRGVRLRATGSGGNGIVFHNACIGAYGYITFEGCSGAQLALNECAVVSCVGPVTAKGTSPYHIYAGHGSVHLILGSTTTFDSATYTSAVHRADRGGGMNLTGGVYVGTPTGKKWEIDDLSGGWITYATLASLPGTSEGTFTSAGDRVTSSAAGNVAIAPATPNASFALVVGANGGAVAGNRGLKVGDLHIGNPGANYGGFGTNIRFTSTTDSWLYHTTAPVAMVDFELYGIRFRQAGSGTAGTAITWTDIWSTSLAGKHTFHKTDDSGATVGDAPVDMQGGAWVRKALRVGTNAHITGNAIVGGDIQLTGSLKDAGGTNTIINAQRHFVNRSYTIATLPVSGVAGEEISCSDLPGGAGQMEWRDSAWHPVGIRPQVLKRLEWRVVPGEAAIQEAGLSATSVGTPALVVPSNASFFASQPRRKITSAAATNSGAGVWGDATLSVWRGNAAGLGGFRLVWHFGFELVSSGASIFCGLYASTSQFPANADPHAAAHMNVVGVGVNSGGANLCWLHNDDTSGVGTLTSLGTNFPAKQTATDWYRFEMWCRPNASSIQVRLSRLNTGHTTGAVNLTTNIPNANALMSPHLLASTRVDSAALEIAHGDLFLEAGALL